MNATRRMSVYFVLSSYTLCPVEGLRDHSCAIATPARRGQLKQLQLLPATLGLLAAGHCMSPGFGTEPSRVATRQDSASPHMVQITNNTL